MPFKVGGVDYSPSGIEALRADLIKMRDQALSCEPVPDFSTSVILSHTIAMLAYLIDMVKEQEEARSIGWTNPITDSL